MQDSIVTAVWEAFYRWQSTSVPSERYIPKEPVTEIVKFAFELGKMHIWTIPAGHTEHAVSTKTLKSKEKIIEGIPEFAAEVLAIPEIPWLKDDKSIVERMTHCMTTSSKMVLLLGRYSDFILPE